MPDHAIKLAVAAASTGDDAYADLLPHVRQILLDAVVEFQLAPDDLVDTGRLPSTVIDLNSLVSYLGQIKDEISRRDSSVATKDWEAAKQGRLRLYKVFVCAIHALAGYMSNGFNEDASLSKHASQAVAYAKAHPPERLSTSGQTLWTKTFDDNSARAAGAIRTLLYLATQTAEPTTAPPPAPVEDPATASSTAV